jgi:DNA invertase Pin-like site-specific DNA recombinase
MGSLGARVACGARFRNLPLPKKRSARMLDPRRSADLTPEKVEHARKAIRSGEQSVTGMAKLFGVHRVTLHKALKKQVTS